MPLPEMSSSRLETAPFGMGSPGPTDTLTMEMDSGRQVRDLQVAATVDDAGHVHTARSRRSSPARAPYSSRSMARSGCCRSRSGRHWIRPTKWRRSRRPSGRRRGRLARGLGAADVAGQRRIGRGRGLPAFHTDGVRRLRRDRRDRPPSARCPCSWRLRSRRGRSDLPATLGGQETQLEPVAQAFQFPSTVPNTPFMVVSGPRTRAGRGRPGGRAGPERGLGRGRRRRRSPRSRKRDSSGSAARTAPIEGSSPSSPRAWRWG